MAGRGAPVRLVELRVLEGPNLYFTRPAVKLTLGVPGFLRADEARLERAAKAVDLPTVRGRSARPGLPESEERRRFVARLAAHLTRTLARAAGIGLAVRGRPGWEKNDVIVAYPWRRRGQGKALGKEVPELLASLLAGRRSMNALVGAAAARVREAEPGPPPTVLEPTVPVIAVTGTNGKTTTVRLLAHLVRSAGKKVAYSSTDGVFVSGRLVEPGDYSGPKGAASALAHNPHIAILETARGGILLTGMGTAHNDVAVVTNVQADHLDLHGVRTLDQLAEVKAAITRITKRDGWDVLNADDPRVLGMRRVATGRPFLFSLDPDNPALRHVVTEGGRGISVLDGALTVFGPGSTTRSLLPVEEIPMTLAGISSQHVENAMAGTAAALGIGLPVASIVAGLRSFIPDPERNPGRANVFELDGKVVVVDYAHNVDGIRGLVEIVRGLRAPGAKTWVAYCAAGDRTPEIQRGMGEAAAKGVDHLAIAALPRYYRGRDPADILGNLRGGAVEAGRDPADVPDFPGEIEALEWMLESAAPRDVVGIAALASRFEIFDLLRSRGGRRTGPGRIRQLVRRARRVVDTQPVGA